MSGNTPASLPDYRRGAKTAEPLFKIKYLSLRSPRLWSEFFASFPNACRKMCLLGIADRIPHQMDALINPEEGERITDALSRLPAAMREALLLRYQEEMTLEEISRIVAVPLPTVKSRIYRGLEALRSLLERDRV